MSKGTFFCPWQQSGPSRWGRYSPTLMSRCATWKIHSGDALSSARLSIAHKVGAWKRSSCIWTDWTSTVKPELRRLLVAFSRAGSVGRRETWSECGRMIRLRIQVCSRLKVVRMWSGVKVSRNAPKRRSGVWKFKPGVFRLQNYWISQPERTFLGPAS